MKKVLLVGIMFMMFMGVVSASSINGDYKGNPKVIVAVNGKTINSDVPAIIYDGSTLIPLRAAVEAMGGSVNWDATTNSANITTNNSNGTFNKETLISNMLKDNQNAIKWNARNVKYVVNELGSYVMVDVLATSNNKTDLNNIATVSTYLLDTDADMIFVNYYNGETLQGFYTIYKEDVNGMFKSKSPNDYYKLWKWNPNTLITNSTSVPTTNTDTIVTSGTVESTIDGEFTGWTGETIFKLTNGQIWQQSLYAYYYHYSYSPNVTIYSTSSGYKMKVDGVDDTIYVKRIK